MIEMAVESELPAIGISRKGKSASVVLKRGILK
jgi:hypothetical protein